MPHRAVLVGCGAMSKGWIRAIKETQSLSSRIEVVGLVDVQPAAAETLRQEFGLEGAATGSHLETMLERLKPDVLFDVAVPSARPEIVTLGLRHGCHVLSEKPMAPSLEDARSLVRLAQATGRIHAVVQNRRYVPGVRRIREFIASGAIGELTALHCDFFIGAHFGGFREQMEHVLLLDMSIHTMDAARFMSGKTPLAVYCQESNPRGSWYAHGAAANAIFELSDDVVFTYRGSWCAEGANTSWESTWRITGTTGTLLWDGADTFIANRVASDKGFLRETEAIAVPEPSNAGQTQGHTSVLTEFIDSIETGRSPETAGSDNINSLAMVFGAIASARSRGRVEIAA